MEDHLSPPLLPGKRVGVGHDHPLLCLSRVKWKVTYPFPYSQGREWELAMAVCSMTILFFLSGKWSGGDSSSILVSFPIGWSGGDSSFPPCPGKRGGVAHGTLLLDHPLLCLSRVSGRSLPYSQEREWELTMAIWSMTILFSVSIR